MSEIEREPLWQRDFTILTLGSVVSMFGNTLSGFAMSLLVLDYTQSTFLYAVYMAVFTLPHIIMPVFSGAFLDRFSRRRTIYTLDFLSSAIYLVSAYILSKGWFSFPVLAFFVFVIGSINSVYTVAFQSFYPLLISKGNYSKAYSIQSVLETASMIMVPVAAWMYHAIGISPLLAVNAACFFTAAAMETRIRTHEDYIDTQKETVSEKKYAKQMLKDIREGIGYLKKDNALFAIAAYFTVCSLAYGALSVLVLPWFRSAYPNGEYVYMIVAGMSVAGRGIGGFLHYKVRLPKEKKFMIAFFVYVVTALLEGTYLFMPLTVMIIFSFISGILSVTSYTIRISAVQAYVPDEKKGRFNGAFNMLNTCGNLVGELAAGALGVYLSSRMIIFTFMMVNCLAAAVIMGRNRHSVSLVYNNEQ